MQAPAKPTVGKVDWIRAAAPQLLYRAIWTLAIFVMGVRFPVRVSGYRRIPRTGGLLVVANHGSYFDPLLLGLTAPRPMGYIAMDELFQWPAFRWLIETLGAIKLEREGSALQGLRNTIKKLGDGKAIVIFPEGTRTEDGNIQPLKPGTLLLVRRAKVPIVVAGIAGAFEAWPLTQRYPLAGPVWVHYDHWQYPKQADEKAALAELERAMRSAHDEAQRHYRQMTRVFGATPRPVAPRW